MTTHNAHKGTSSNNLTKQREHILWALGVLHPTRDVVELRIPKMRRGRQTTAVGYFDDYDRLADAALTYHDRAAGIYVTLNSINPALLARTNNQIVEPGKSATSDGDVVQRRWLPIDVDPARPADVSSSEEEHQFALALAGEIRDWLSDEGWPDPVLIDSGNGAHVLYPIELPNSADATALVERCLQALAAMWNRESGIRLSVDTKVGNAARIWKLPGTRAGKGAHTDDRPHRYARLLQEPGDIVQVSEAQLQWLASLAPRAQSRTSNPNGSERPKTPFDVALFLERHAGAINPGEPHEKEYGRIWSIDCLWNSAHGRKAHITQLQNGALSAGCQSTSCTWNWQDLHARLDGGAKNNEREPSGRGADDGVHFTHNYQTKWPADDLIAATFDDPVWIVPDLIPAGLTTQGGRPKIGKSRLALQTAVAVAAGGQVLGKTVEKRRVLYLALEDGPRRLQERLVQMRYTPGSDLTFHTEWPTLLRGGFERLIDEIEQGDYAFTVIDTASRFYGVSKADDEFRVADYLAQLQRYLLEGSRSIMQIAHHRKAAATIADVIDDVMGGTAYTAVLDAVMGLYRGRGQPNAELRVVGRDLLDQELALRLDLELGCWQLVGEAGAVRSDTVQGQILAVLESDFDGTATVPEIASALSRDKSNIRKEVLDLVGKGLLCESGRQGRQKIYQLPNTRGTEERGDIGE